MCRSGDSRPLIFLDLRREMVTSKTRMIEKLRRSAPVAGMQMMMQRRTAGKGLVSGGRMRRGSWRKRRSRGGGEEKRGRGKRMKTRTRGGGSEEKGSGERGKIGKS